MNFAQSVDTARDLPTPSGTPAEALEPKQAPITLPPISEIHKLVHLPSPPQAAPRTEPPPPVFFSPAHRKSPSDSVLVLPSPEQVQARDDREFVALKTFLPASHASDESQSQPWPQMRQPNSHSMITTYLPPSHAQQQQQHYQHENREPVAFERIPVKGKRKRASPEQLRVLNAVFEQTFFPSTELRTKLARELGMAPRAIQIWFQNKRQNFRLRNREGAGRGLKKDEVDLERILGRALQPVIVGVAENSCGDDDSGYAAQHDRSRSLNDQDSWRPPADHPHGQQHARTQSDQPAMRVRPWEWDRRDEMPAHGQFAHRRASLLKTRRE